MLIWFLVSLFAFMALGIPVSLSLGLTTLVLLQFCTELPLVLLPQQMVTGADNYALIAIPFFMLAAEIMSCGGITHRIIGFFVAVIGWVRGGLALVVVGSAMVVSSFTGSSVADASMIGGVMIPAMKEKNYEPEFAAAVVAVATTLGVIIPPSIPMVVLGYITGNSVLDMFFGGIVPGIVIGCALLVMVYWLCRGKNIPLERRLSLREVLHNVREAGWALLLPVIVLGGLRFGFFTVTESSVFAVVYALFVSAVIHRELTFALLYRACVNAAMLAAVVMLIVACATGSAWILASEQVPEQITNAMMAMTDSPTIFMALTVVFLLIVGMVMDLTPAVLILGPILLPMGVKYGIDPIHMAVVMVITLAYGLVTPPVGTTLYLCSGIAKASAVGVVRQSLPMLAVAIVMLFVVAFVPALTTWLPMAVR